MSSRVWVLGGDPEAGELPTFLGDVPLAHSFRRAKGALQTSVADFEAASITAGGPLVVRCVLGWQNTGHLALGSLLADEI